MSDSITCSTEMYNLAITAVLFILVDVFCEFAMLANVYILLSPEGEEIHSSSWGYKHIYISPRSAKRLIPLPVIILLCLGNKS